MVGQCLVDPAQHHAQFLGHRAEPAAVSAAVDRVRLELYRRLSACEEPHDVVEIEAEIEDRFGRPDLPTRQFLDLVTIKVLARKKGIERISNYNENITLQYNDEKKAYLKARSRDDDDLLATVLEALRR
jgi:transcription-repair coupling factor (superfamily II helicase)